MDNLQNQNLNCLRLSCKPSDRLLKRRKRRSILDGFGQKMYSVYKKVCIYLLNENIKVYSYKGDNMTHDNCTKLISEFLDGKKRSKDYLLFFFKIDNNHQKAKQQMLKYIKNKSITDYFEQDLERLIQQKKKNAQILKDFDPIIPYAFWYLVFGNRTVKKTGYLQQINTKFNQLFSMGNFDQYISEKQCLDMTKICDKLLPEIRKQEINNSEDEKLANIPKQPNIRKKTKKNYNLQKFEIKQQSRIKKFRYEDQEKVMMKFLQFHKELLSLNDDNSQEISQLHSSHGLAPENIYLQRQEQSEASSEEESISEARSRLSDNEELMDVYEQSNMQTFFNNANSNQTQNEWDLFNEQQIQQIFMKQQNFLSQDVLFNVFAQVLAICKQNNQNKNQCQMSLMSQSQIEQEIFDKQPQGIKCEFWTDKYQWTNEYFLSGLLKK